MKKNDMNNLGASYQFPASYRYHKDINSVDYCDMYLGFKFVILY